MGVRVIHTSAYINNYLSSFDFYAPGCSNCFTVAAAHVAVVVAAADCTCGFIVAD